MRSKCTTNYSQYLRPGLLTVLFAHHLFILTYLSVQVKFLTFTENEKKKLYAHINMGWRFMTIWNFFSQTVYLGLEVLTIYSAIEKSLSERIKAGNRVFYWSIVYPYSIYIVIFFWSVYFYDRELIFPKSLDILMPPALNHSVHTLIMVPLIIEHKLARGKPPTFSRCVKPLAAYSLLYGLLINYTYLVDGIWLYGYLRVISWPARMAYYTLTTLACFVFLKCGLVLQNRLNRENVDGKPE